LRVPIHREGWLFIAIACAANVILFVLTPIAGWVFLPITIWVVAFFRDPERRTPLEPDLYICPADGKMLPVVQSAPPRGAGDGPCRPHPAFGLHERV
jgi:phosphatidylserine decarboxylase